MHCTSEWCVLSGTVLTITRTSYTWCFLRRAVKIAFKGLQIEFLDIDVEKCVGLKTSNPCYYVVSLLPFFERMIEQFDLVVVMRIITQHWSAYR
jgi:hypothetical protein